MTMTRLLLAFFAITTLSVDTARSQASANEPMQITIDVGDLARKLLHAELVLPLDGAADSPRKVALWYPKWVPGSQ